MTIQIVPVIEHAEFNAWHRHNIELIQGLPRLHQAQKSESTVQHTHISISGNHNNVMMTDSDRTNYITFFAQHFQFKFVLLIERLQHWHGLWRSSDKYA